MRPNGIPKMDEKSGLRAGQFSYLKLHLLARSIRESSGKLSASSMLPGPACSAQQLPPDSCQQKHTVPAAGLVRACWSPRHTTPVIKLD